MQGSKKLGIVPTYLVRQFVSSPVVLASSSVLQRAACKMSHTLTPLLAQWISAQLSSCKMLYLSQRSTSHSPITNFPMSSLPISTKNKVARASSTHSARPWSHHTVPASAPHGFIHHIRLPPLTPSPCPYPHRCHQCSHSRALTHLHRSCPEHTRRSIMHSTT